MIEPRFCGIDRSMHARSLSALSLVAALGVACSGNPTPSADVGPTTDTGVPDEDGGVPLDSGVVDTGVVARDAGFADGGDPPLDGGPELDELLVPGAYVQVREGRVSLMQDTFEQVKAVFGPGTRTAVANTRSYEWALSGGVTLTVWFANSNLDGDDAPPNDVDSADVALWAAVQGGFTGETPTGVGLGDPRAEVELAFGAAPNEVALTNPPGTLLQYFSTGILVALDAQGLVRTLTVHRAYGSEPDAIVDVDDGRLRFTEGDIEGQDGLTRGTNKAAVTDLLGMPDAQGALQISGQSLTTWSYGFIGVELFFLENRDTVFFMNVHPPFYGLTPGATGMGSTRAEMEAFLSGAGYDNGTASGSNSRFICYAGPIDVGVTYSQDNPPLVTSITSPLLACP